MTEGQGSQSQQQLSLVGLPENQRMKLIASPSEPVLHINEASNNVFKGSNIILSNESGKKIHVREGAILSRETTEAAAINI